jgi:hypothetical protein
VSSLEDVDAVEVSGQVKFLKRYLELSSFGVALESMVNGDDHGVLQTTSRQKCH